MFACFLDASVLSAVVRLLHNWYVERKLRVHLNRHTFDPFNISNGAQQGGVLSPILFTIYFDRLLLELKKKGVGCYWGHHFAGALAYADDVVLLAPSASALRLMFCAYEDFASSNGVSLNPSKTQLIRFSLFKSHSCDSSFIFCNQALPLVCSITH